MNFKDFKKIDVTKTHTVFKHPDGHTIQVAHDSLTPEQKKQMREIPIQSAKERLREEREAVKMSKGGWTATVTRLPDTPQGPVPGATVAHPQTLTEEERDKYFPERKEQLMEQMAGLELGKPKGDYEFGKATEEVLGRKFEEKPKAPSLGVDISKYLQPSQPAAPEAQAAMPQSAAEKAMIAESEAAKETALIQQREQEEQLKQSELAQKQLSNAINRFAKHKEDLQAKITDIQKAVNDNVIDPNRYMGNMDTIGRISTALGLILGGIGAGMTGRDNLAFKALENAIDRDVDAQKQELGKKNNLLTAYYKMYGDMEQAELATKSQIMADAQFRSQQIAAKSRSLEAGQRAQLIDAQLGAKKEALMQQQAALAADKELSAQTQVPTAPRPSDEQVMNYIDRRNLPDKQKEKLKESYTEALVAQEQMVIFKQLMNDQFELSRLAKMKDPLQRMDLLKTYAIALAPQVKAVTGETRLSNEEFEKFVEPLISKFYTSPETLQKQINIMLATKAGEFRRHETALKGIGLHGYGMPVMGTPIKTSK